MPDPFIGEIRMFAGNFAPQGWALCNGQLLPIAQNTALFSVLGTTYGGNGVQDFALPDLRGRCPINQGQGQGLSNFLLGEQVGNETTTLTAQQMPSHNHTISACSNNGDQSSPQGNVLAVTSGKGHDTFNTYTAPAKANTTTAPTGSAGGSLPVGIRSPSLAVSFIIALVGSYPSRG
ncbi:MAG TPA: tail fiber protein [Bryobacteraceae bacterium]|nr:tail fiber protein [Bryobacteraceae bacterium]